MDRDLVPDSSGDDWAALVDVSQLSIGDLFASDNSALGLCVRRLVASLDDPDGVVSAFSNFSGA